MKLQIFSDLHVGIGPLKPITVGKSVDAIAVGGGVCEGAKNSFVATPWIVPEVIPVIFVMGNGKPAALKDGHRA